MECNAKKCFSIRFGKCHTENSLYTIKDSALQSVSQIKDLGVIFDPKMSYKEHIKYMELKVRKKIYFIKRFSNKFSKAATFRTLYMHRQFGIQRKNI